MMTTYVRYLQQLKFEYRSVVACDPRLGLLHLPCLLWGQYRTPRDRRYPIKRRVVGKQTEFVLDGFQGSGNSFGTAAFQLSQTRPVVIAHHMHRPAQIIKAVRAEIPTLVVIRDPAGAVLSLVSRWPYVSIHQALRSYVRFYNKVAPYADGYVVSLFDQTIERFDEVIRRVNRKFGTNFDVIDYNGVQMQMLRRRFAEQLAQDKQVKRREVKAAKARELQNHRDRLILETAEAVYRSFERHAMNGP